jgi:hypothetical protein
MPKRVSRSLRLMKEHQWLVSKGRREVRRRTAMLQLVSGPDLLFPYGRVPLSDTTANGSKAADVTPASTEPNGDADDLSKGVNGLAISGDKPSVPTTETAAGAPEGDVVFDHKPTESELKEVRDSLDVSRSSAEVDGKKK